MNDRAEARQRFSWMSKGTFGVFYAALQVLRQGEADGTITPAQVKEIMALVEPTGGKRPNASEFCRRVYTLSGHRLPNELTRHQRPDGEVGDVDGKPLPPRQGRQPDLRRAELREQFSWMSDGTFAAYWTSVQALMRLVKSGLISYDQAEQIRKDIPKMPSGRPNIHEFQRRVKIVEQRVEAKYGRSAGASQPTSESSQMTADSQSATDSTQSSFDSHQASELIVIAPVVNGRKLVPVSKDGRRVKLAWVAAEPATY